MTKPNSRRQGLLSGKLGKAEHIHGHDRAEPDTADNGPPFRFIPLKDVPIPQELTALKRYRCEPAFGRAPAEAILLSVPLAELQQVNPCALQTGLPFLIGNIA